MRSETEGHERGRLLVTRQVAGESEAKAGDIPPAHPPKRGQLEIVRAKGAECYGLTPA